MIRPASLALVLLGLSASACARSQPPVSISAAILRPVVTAGEGEPRGLSSASDLAIAPDGAPIAAASGRLFRLPEWAPLSASGRSIDRFAAGPATPLFAVSGTSLGVVSGGVFSEIAELPAAGMAVRAAESGDALYVYGRESGERSAVYRLQLGDRRPVYRKWIQITERVGALCPVGNDVIFAVKDTLYRAGMGPADKLVIAFVATLYGVDVTDLERDEKNEILYVASPAALYAYYGGRVSPLLHTGGRIRLSGDYLFLLDAARPQIVVVEHPERLVFDRGHAPESL